MITIMGSLILLYANNRSSCDPRTKSEVEFALSKGDLLLHTFVSAFPPQSVRLAEIG